MTMYLLMDGGKGRCINIIAFCCHRCAYVLYTGEWPVRSLVRFVLYKTVCHIVHFVMRCVSHAERYFTHHHGPEETSCFAQEGCPQEEGGEAQVAQAPQQQEGCCAQAQEEEELQEGLGDVSTRRRGHWFCLQEVFQCVGAGAGLIFARSLTFGLLFLFL